MGQAPEQGEAARGLRAALVVIAGFTLLRLLAAALYRQGRAEEAARALAIPAVELHTGRYAQVWRDDPGALQQLRDAATHASSLGLAVHAGHGLTYQNVEPVAQIETIEEFNIGHSVVSRAIMTGIGVAVAEMAALVKIGRDYH